MSVKRSQRGAALVEAAIVLPFLIMLVLGVIDFARAYFDAAKVQEVAEEGVIWASLNPGAPTDAIARAEQTIQNPNFTGAVSVSCPGPGTDQVSVTVAYTFTLVTPLISNMFGPTLDLSHTETGRVLSSDPCVASP